MSNPVSSVSSSTAASVYYALATQSEPPKQTAKSSGPAQDTVQLSAKAQAASDVDHDGDSH